MQFKNTIGVIQGLMTICHSRLLSITFSLHEILIQEIPYSHICSSKVILYSRRTHSLILKHNNLFTLRYLLYADLSLLLMVQRLEFTVSVVLLSLYFMLCLNRSYCLYDHYGCVLADFFFHQLIIYSLI